MDEQQQPPQIEPIPNLVLLKVLCVFTFVGSGLGAFSYGIIGIVHSYFSENLSLIPDEQNRELIGMLLAAGRTFFFLNAILYAISLFGAILLWKLKKAGFHLYTASQMLLLILPLLYIKSFPANVFSVFLTFLFVLGYFGFLKYMK
jgi:hypothetical protein